MPARALTTLLILTSLAAAGCGGGGGDGGKTASAKSGDEPTATPTPDPGIATVDYTGGAITLDGLRLRVDSLRREGPFMTLNATVKCVRPEAGDSECLTQSAFGRGAFDNNVFAGVLVVDTSGQRVYTVARQQSGGATQDSGDPYTSELEPRTEPSAPARHVWARYAAPPADVKAVDLVLPEGGPRIANVPITEGGGVDTDPPAGGEQAATPAEFDRPPDSTDTSGLLMGDYDLTVERTSKRRKTEDRRGRRVVTLAADVLFDFDEATLGSDGSETLDQLAEEVADSASTGPIAIDGYTDSKGSDGYNRDLSQRRADTVEEGLAGALDGRELRAVGRGEADPVAPNTKNGSDNPAGRAKNRRVTVGYTLARKDPEAEATPAPTATSAPADAPQAMPWNYTGSGDTARFEVQPVGVTRAGNLSVLDLDIKCVQSSSDDCDEQFALALPDMGGDDAGAITLVDPAQDSTYRAAFFKGGYYVVGTTPRLRPGIVRRLSVFFGSVPATSTSVTVQLPSGGPRFDGVPVTG